MRCRILVAVLAAAVFPAATPADDRWEEWSDDRPSGGYDVSVDLNVQGGVTFESFHGALQPHGDWVVVGSYGRVWRPRVAAGWRPYYYGRWEWTNEGWFWVSDEPWGWAAYHYGRWAYDPYYGWLWVPGYEWAPAWVSWRTSGDVIGWAPLAPGFSVYVSTYPFIDFWWTFVPSVRFVSVPVYTAAYAPGHARRWFDATAPAPARPAPRRGYAAAPSPAWGGPAPRHIEQRIGRPVTPARIVRSPSPGAGSRPGEIPVYRGERHGGGAPGFARPHRDERVVPAPGNGRGPGPAPAPGWAGQGGGSEHRAAPPARGDGRGPGPAPAPGWAGQGGERGRGGDGAVHPHEQRGGPPARSHGGGDASRGRGGGSGERAGQDGGGRGGGHGGGRGARPERR